MKCDSCVHALYRKASGSVECVYKVKNSKIWRRIKRAMHTGKTCPLFESEDLISRIRKQFAPKQTVRDFSLLSIVHWRK